MKNKGGDLKVGVGQRPLWIFSKINATMMSSSQG